MKTQNNYPDFQPNQVLTNTQLNELREYLDDQTRLSRVRLTGTGIICGLFAHQQKDFSIKITGGYGISSDGYLIELSDRVCSKYRNYTDPLLVEPDSDDELPCPQYVPWQTAANPKQQIPILELLSEDELAAPDFVEEKGNASKKLTKAITKDKVLVVYLEMENSKLPSCIVTDCNNKGEDVVLTVRILLIDKKYLQPVKLCSGKDNLVTVPRLITYLHSQGKTLSDVKSSDLLNKAYGGLYENTASQINTEVEKVYEKYKYVLDLETVHESDVAKLKDKLGKITDKSVNQYHFDFIRDLAKAYNEFADAVCPLVKNCMFDGFFPRHLMLIDFPENPDLMAEEIFRHKFVSSPARNVLHEDLVKAQKYFTRIFELIANFETGLLESTKVTPGQMLRWPLGKRTIPHYYSLIKSSTIEKWWQPAACCELAQPLSYVKNSMEKNPGMADALDPQKHPLHLDPGPFDFYNIEGHLGKSVKVELEEIEKIKSVFNLPFNLIQLRLSGSNSQSYAELCDYNDLQLEYLTLSAELKCVALKMWKFINFEKDDDVALYEALGLVSSEEIKKLKELLTKFQEIFTADLKDFDFEAFKSLVEETFNMIIKVKVALNTTFLEITQNSNYRYPAEFYAKLSNVLSEIFHWLEDFIQECVYQQIAVVVAIFNYRMEYYKANDPELFSNFVKKHHGIEHLAGVEKGGTFILVYSGAKKDDQKAIDVVADFSLPYLCCTNQQCIEIPAPEKLETPEIKWPEYRRIDFGAYLFTNKHLVSYRSLDELDYMLIDVVKNDIVGDSFALNELKLGVYKSGAQRRCRRELCAAGTNANKEGIDLRNALRETGHCLQTCNKRYRRKINSRRCCCAKSGLFVLPVSTQ